MSEDEKIEQIISKYQTFIDDSDADITKSVKGEWHFYRYNEEYKNYDCFIRFKTAQDLEHIIVSEIADDMNLAIECAADSIAHSYGYEDVNQVTKTSNYEENVRRLVFNLKVIDDHMHLFETVAKEVRKLK